MNRLLSRTEGFGVYEYDHALALWIQSQAEVSRFEAESQSAFVRLDS